MRLEGDDRVDDATPSTNDMENFLAVEVDQEHDWHLCYIPPSGVIDLRSSLCGNFSAIREKCRLYGSDRPATVGGVCQTAPWVLNTVAERCKALPRQATAQTSVQELESEESRLCKANESSTSFPGAVARIQGALVDACTQGGEQGLAGL